MSEHNNENLGLMEALHSTPARRYLSQEPISDELIWELLDAAIRGPSGGNNQGWGWIVVKDQSVKKQIATWYREGWDRAYGVRREQILAGNDPSDTLGSRNFRSAEYLANHLEEAPVWIFAVQRNTSDENGPRTGSSIYGAIQHLMLAARFHGIVASLTTLYAGHESDVKNLLGVPDDAMTMALIPLGYPSRGRWAQPKRQDVQEVTHWEKWNDHRNR